MKFKWKLFLWMMTVITLSFGISGSMMITSSFHVTYGKEVEIAKEEHEIMQNTFIMVLSHLSKNLTDAVWRQVAKDLDDTNTRDSFYFQIENAGNQEIYQSYSMRKDSVASFQREEALPENGCFLYRDGGNYYLMTRSAIRAGEDLVYLNVIRDVSDIFKSRQNQLFVFYRIMFILIVANGLFAYVIAYFLSKPLMKLSKVTRTIAEGDLTSRANLEGYDEIGELGIDIDRMADKLEKDIEELNDAVRRQEDFVGNFAHELKTPLTSIIGYADMLRSRKLSQDMIFSSANYIFSEGKRLEGMSFKLLELLVTKQNDISLKNIDAEYFFDEIAGAMTPVMEKEGITLSLKAEEGYFQGDKDLLKSVLFNLIDNARKALASSDNKKIEITGEVKEEESEYILKIRDYGTGIPKDELSKITEAFYMVDKSRARQQGGAGLGLALCKQIMELHGGKMEIESEVGVGTCFTLNLKGGKQDEQ